MPVLCDETVHKGDGIHAGVWGIPEMRLLYIWILAVVGLLIYIGISGQPPADATSLEIDAEMILPDTPTPEIFTTPAPSPPAVPEPISNVNLLKDILTDDTTDQHLYIASGQNTYVCVHFATDLAQNLTDDGYDAGVVVRSAKWHGRGSGHMLTWIQLEDDLFIIEAGNDTIYLSNDFNASIDTEIYVLRYESLESGYRKAREEYRRRN